MRIKSLHPAAFILLLLLSLSGLVLRPAAVWAGFTPTPTPTETPTPTPTPTETPAPPPPPPPPPPTETPTPAPLLPEVGGVAPSPWLFWALGAAALLAGWRIVKRKK